MSSNIQYLDNIEQGTREWFLLRKQRPLTSSHSQAILAKGRGLEKLCSPKLQKEKEHFSNKHTQRGNELEPYARDLYERFTKQKVLETGFVINSKYEYAGSSPDGLIGLDGLIEIKSPNHLKYKKLLNDFNNGKFKIEKGYYYQMQHQLLITERKWVDYVVYDPECEFPMIIVRVYPDLVIQEKLKLGIKIGEQIIKKNYGL